MKDGEHYSSKFINVEFICTESLNQTEKKLVMDSIEILQKEFAKYGIKFSTPTTQGNKVMITALYPYNIERKIAEVENKEKKVEDKKEEQSKNLDSDAIRSIIREELDKRDKENGNRKEDKEVTSTSRRFRIIW